MKKVLHAAALVAMAGLLVLAWQRWFPSEEKKVRFRLHELAKAASYSPDQNSLGRLSGAARLTDFFSREAEIHVEIPGVGQRTFHGREEIRETALTVRGVIRGLKVEVFDIVLTLGTDKRSAMAELTAKITPLSSSEDFHVQEMKMLLRKVDDQWLVTRVETVRTLGL